MSSFDEADKLKDSRDKEFLEQFAEDSYKEQFESQRICDLERQMEEENL